MTDFEDRDIKIFSKNSKQDETDALIDLVEVIARQRSNGNVEKARLLGEDAADTIIDSDLISKFILGSVPDEDTVYQIRLLFTFVAESSLRSSLEIPSLSTVAVNAMYKKLSEFDSELYENTTDAFTFYYLALRRANNIEGRIGNRFAMLCSKENDEEYKKMGTTLYTEICKMFNEKISNADFVE